MLQGSVWIDKEGRAILFNFFVIFGTLLVLSLIMLGINLFFKKCFFPITEKIGTSIAVRIPSRWTVFILEIVYLAMWSFFVFSVIMVYIVWGSSSGISQLYLSLGTLFLVFVILIGATALHEVRKNNINDKTSIISKIGKINIDKLKAIYIINRLWLLLGQTLEFSYAFLIYFLSLTFLVALEWTADSYFLSICFIPLYANYWVYFTKIIRINENISEVFIRRVFMYTLSMIFLTYQLFEEFQQYIYEQGVSKDWMLYMFAGSAVMYIALDRILKEVTVDYIGFKKPRDDRISN
ncbi:hypothetical protein [Paenibacillus caseinilyticus]|uniref:hypothetical protein n=1 Tax=Paenibacillus caseinilyticus TaxID=3098138 RepID=UPI0022B8AF3B|nr:hypothetical protein [Paenibacillus caseinilyticus]MCZ8519873.1 hypothetical protein [Paenibacillus caseinilyticus]